MIVSQVHASLGTCKKHLGEFPKYVWNKGIHHLISMNIFLLEKRRRDLMSTPPSKWETKFCLVRRGVRSLSTFKK
jgi:hypothetical protein